MTHTHTSVTTSPSECVGVCIHRTGSSLLFFGEVSVSTYDLFVLGEACLRCYRWLETEKKKASMESKNTHKH